jgi:phage terminase small subunit
LDSKEWKKRIIAEMKKAGTYNECFLSAIEALADILNARDRAKEQFEKSGGSTIVKHTNKGGATNLEQNPALRLMNDLNRDALQYWRDLGLTPKGLKAISEEALKPEKTDPFVDKIDQLLGR